MFFVCVVCVCVCTCFDISSGILAPESNFCFCPCLRWIFILIYHWCVPNFKTTIISPLDCLWLCLTVALWLVIQPCTIAVVYVRLNLTVLLRGQKFNKTASFFVHNSFSRIYLSLTCSCLTSCTCRLRVYPFVPVCLCNMNTNQTCFFFGCNSVLHLITNSVPMCLRYFQCVMVLENYHSVTKLKLGFY